MLNGLERTQQDAQDLTSAENLLDVPVVNFAMAQGLDGCLLRQEVDVIGILHPIEVLDDSRLGIGDATTDGGLSPCLAERLQDNQVFILIQDRQHRAFIGEVNVGFVNDNNLVREMLDNRPTMYIIIYKIKV